MAFLVWPDASANSYVSVAAADTYFELLLHADNWTAATTGTKEKALATATNMMDRKNWQGSKTSDSQPLEWPRTGVTDKNGDVVASDSLPQALLDGCCELALSLINDATVQTAAATGGDNVKSMTTGKTSVDFFSPSSPIPSGATFPAIAQEYLGQFLALSSTAIPYVDGTDVESEFDDDDRQLREEGWA